MLNESPAQIAPAKQRKPFEKKFSYNGERLRA
jgi:hypothetical protein